MKKRPLGLLYLIVPLLVLPLPLVMILNRYMIDSPSHLFAYDLGITAYVWWLMLIYWSTRPAWLVKRVEMPTLYAVHGATGVLALIAATIHRSMSFSMFPLIKQTGNLAWYLEIFLIIHAIFFLSGIITDRVTMVRKAKKVLEKRILTHQTTMWLHRLNLVAVALIAAHVQLIPRLRVLPFFIPIFWFYTIASLSSYGFWKVKRLRQTGQILENRPLTPGVQALTLALPNNRHIRNYKAGDFFFLSFQKKSGLYTEPHPFSVSAKPLKGGQKAEFQIRRLGDFTKNIGDLPVGTQVKIEGPFGAFDELVKDFSGPIVLYGLGSGVAPLLSLAEAYNGQKDLHLVWTGPMTESSSYQKPLAALANGGVTIDKQKHRFTQKQLQELVSKDEIKKGMVIMVGDSFAILSLRKRLKELGFKNQQLFDERMTM